MRPAWIACGLLSPNWAVKSSEIRYGSNDLLVLFLYKQSKRRNSELLLLLTFILDCFSWIMFIYCTSNGDISMNVFIRWFKNIPKYHLVGLTELTREALSLARFGSGWNGNRRVYVVNKQFVEICQNAALIINRFVQKHLMTKLYWN